MSRWRKVEAGTWGDRRFSELSERAKLLWFYLITGPEVTNLPGLLMLGRAQFAEAMGWEVKVLEKVFAELAAENEDGIPMAKADWKARVVLLPSAWKHNVPANPNVVTGWADQWRVVPDCELKTEGGRILEKMVNELGDGFRNAFRKVVGTVSVTVYETVSVTVSQTTSEPSLACARAAPAPAPAPAVVSGGGAGGGDDARPVTLDEPISEAAKGRVETIGMTRGWRPADVEGEWLKYLGKRAVHRPRSELEAGWQNWLIDAQKYAKSDGSRGPPARKAAAVQQEISPKHLRGKEF